MKKAFWDKEIPSLLGLAIIVLGLSATIFLTNKQTFLQTNADANPTPQEVRITNITDNSLTVSYKTSDQASGFINYGTGTTLGQTAFDERDVLKKIQPHILHSITLKNLNPLTKYYFAIISNGNTYLNNNQNFEVTTASTISYSANKNNIVGKIILPDATPPKEAIVYIAIGDSQFLSTLTVGDGSYQIELNHLLTSDLTKLTDLSTKQSTQMHVLGESQNSDAIFFYPQLNNIPVITLSNNYDFKFSDKINSTPAASIGKFPVLKNTPPKPKITPTVTPKITLISPTPKILTNKIASKTAVLSMTTSNIDLTRLLPASRNASIITASIASLLITAVSGLVFLLSRKGI
jgi:hypothetical protein